VGGAHRYGHRADRAGTRIERSVADRHQRIAPVVSIPSEQQSGRSLTNQVRYLDFVNQPRRVLFDFSSNAEHYRGHCIEGSEGARATDV
jgi:hypothetical protein